MESSFYSHPLLYSPWMQWRRTWVWLDWTRRIQTRELERGRWLAIAPPKESCRKTKRRRNVRRWNESRLCVTLKAKNIMEDEKKKYCIQKWTLFLWMHSDSLHLITLACARECEDAIVQMPPKWQHYFIFPSKCLPALPPPLPQLFQQHDTVWCRHPNAPLVKPASKWKSTGGLKLLMVISSPFPLHHFYSPSFSPPLPPSAVLQHPASPLVSAEPREADYSFKKPHSLCSFTSHPLSSALFRLITAVNNKSAFFLFTTMLPKTLGWKKCIYFVILSLGPLTDFWSLWCRFSSVWIWIIYSSSTRTTTKNNKSCYFYS